MTKLCSTMLMLPEGLNAKLMLRTVWLRGIKNDCHGETHLGPASVCIITCPVEADALLSMMLGSLIDPPTTWQFVTVEKLMAVPDTVPLVNVDTLKSPWNTLTSFIYASSIMRVSPCTDNLERTSCCYAVSALPLPTPFVSRFVTLVERFPMLICYVWIVANCCTCSSLTF